MGAAGAKRFEDREGAEQAATDFCTTSTNQLMNTFAHKIDEIHVVG